MGGCLWKNFYFIFFSQSLYCLAYSLIASHINSHSNTNTGLIANNNTNNAMHGLMKNIIINNNIIIYFSLYIEQQGIEPYTTSVHHITLTAVLYSCAKVLRNSLALRLWTIHHSSGQLDSNQHHMFPKHVCYH